MNDNMNSNTICPKCGMINDSNAKFCVKCGIGLQSNTGRIPQVAAMGVEQNVPHATQQSIYNSNVTSQVNNTQQPTYNSNTTSQVNNTQQPTYNSNVTSQVRNIQQPTATNFSTVQTKAVATKKFNFFQYIIGAVLKPFDNFKKHEENLSNLKTTGVLALIVVGFMTIIGLITTMINAVRVTSFWTNEVKWVWDNLKEIKYFKVIGQNLLVYAGILLAISGIYFLACLVIKKETKFSKLLGATVTAFIPFALATSILSPLLSLIYSPLGICITLVGFIYTLLIILELMNDLIKIENKNIKLYFHLVCLSILIIGGGFIVYKLILSSLSSGLGKLLSLF